MDIIFFSFMMEVLFLPNMPGKSETGVVVKDYLKVLLRRILLKFNQWPAPKNLQALTSLPLMKFWLNK